MENIVRKLGTLIAVAVAPLTFVALPACGPGVCGHAPDNFEISGAGAVWDKNKERSTPKEISDYCRQLYRPVTEEFSKTDNKITLPAINYQQGVLSLKGGAIALGRESTLKYQRLTSISLPMVQAQIASCSTSQRTYECVIFKSVEEHPEQRNMKLWLESVKAAQAVSDAVQRYEAAPQPDKAKVETDIRRAIEAAPAPTEELGGPTSALVKPWASELSLANERIAIHSAMLALDHERIRSLTLESRSTRDALEKLTLQNTLLQAAIIRDQHNRSNLNECLTAWNAELNTVQDKRRRLRETVGSLGTFSENDIYSPVSLTLALAGFGACDDTIPSTLAGDIKKISSGLFQLLQPGDDATELGVRVEGFSDQQPIINDRKDPNWALCKKHNFSNLILAHDRASSVWAAIETQRSTTQKSVTLPKPLIIPHDDQFEVDCFSPTRTGKALEDCHAKNRRFSIRLEGSPVTPRLPEVCRTLAPTGASPTSK